MIKWFLSNLILSIVIFGLSYNKISNKSEIGVYFKTWWKCPLNWPGRDNQARLRDLIELSLIENDTLQGTTAKMSPEHSSKPKTYSDARIKEKILEKFETYHKISLLF